MSVCKKIQLIARNSREKGSIEEKEYLLIKEAENIQDRLMMFIYSHRLATHLPSELKIKQVVLLEADIAFLKKKMMRKESTDLAMTKVLTKKQRKASSITVDSENSPKSAGG
jgi:hypothetical protein